MSTVRTLTVVAAIGLLALCNAESGDAAVPAAAQILRAKQEFDGWWEFKTTVSQAPVVPDGESMLGRMALVYELRQNGGSLAGYYLNVREPDDDDDEEKASAVSGVVRNRRVEDSETDESQPKDAGDPAAAAAAALKKLERDVVMVVVVDIPEEDEDIVIRYRGTQLRTDMKGTVEFGKRNKDGKFEKAGDGIFVARKMN